MTGTKERQEIPKLQQMVDRIFAAGQFGRQDYFNQRQSKLNVPKTVERILAAGQLSRQEYFQMAMTMLSEHHITDSERGQINRVFDKLQLGELNFIDS